MVRLNAVLADYQDGVDPDVLNCSRFVCDAIEAMTDENPMAIFDGLDTIEAQLRKLVRMGYKDPLEYAATVLPELDNINYAEVGDIAVFDSVAGLPGFGIVIGDYAKVLRPDGKPGVIPMDQAKKVFKL